ncbi:MAG: DUF3500 domain-containing protein [Myxococcota bacterium]
MRSSRRAFALLALFAVAGGARLAASTEEGSVVEGLTRRAEAFVASLDEDQRETALYAFDDDERFDLRLAPLRLEGLRVDEMTGAQWTEFERLLAEVLSPSGLAKMNTIRSLEREVAETESGVFGFVMEWMRSPGRYFLAMFGEPRPETPWGMRFDGHHLSLNWTAVPGEALSVTPLFLGGQPRVVPDGLERAGLRVLAEEEDRAVLLVNTLSEEERKAARVRFGGGSAFSRPMSVVEGERLEAPQPIGAPARSMSPEARARRDDVVESVLANFVPDVADRHRARIAAQADAIHFGYAVPDPFVGAPLRAGTPLHYRIQGSDFLIEYDNTSEAADHIHLVWREFDGDFGRDVLAEHLRAHH